MPIKFCPHDGCGHSFEFSYAAPNLPCPKCHKDPKSAFANAIPATPAQIRQIPQAHIQDPQTKPTRTFTPARGRSNRIDFSQASDSVEQSRQGSQDQGDYVDKNEVLNAAQELASTIDASDFIVAADRSNVVSSTDLFRPLMQKMREQEGAAKKPRKRKS